MRNTAGRDDAEIEKGQEPHDRTNAILPVRDLPWIDLGTLS